MARNIKFNTNKEATDLLDNLKGSIENKIRTAYNLGYKDGFGEGVSKTTNKMLSRLLEDIEPKDEPQTEVRYTDSTDYQGANDYVTQTDCAWGDAERIETYSCQEHCKHWSDKVGRRLLAECNFEKVR